MDTLSYERFLDKVEPNTETGCWEWSASVTDDGYGQFWFEGGMRRAHVLSYRHTGGDIPDGWEVDHLCRVRNCVLDQHLEAVPKRVNILRGIGPTAVNASLTHCKEGHPFNDDNTRINPKGSRVCVPCERAYMAAYYERNREKLIVAAAKNRKGRG